MIERRTVQVQHICTGCGVILAATSAHTTDRELTYPQDAGRSDGEPVTHVVAPEDGEESGVETTYPQDAGVNPFLYGQVAGRSEKEGLLQWGEETSPPISSSDIPDMLAEALALAGHGFAVFPVHVLRGGGCSCGGATCEGKHSAVALGYKSATTDEVTIRRWWTTWPDYNIGILAEASRLVVIDADRHDGGPDGLSAWRELAAREGFPATLTARTGGGGLHVLYRLLEGVELGNSRGVLPLGIDVRARGYIVAAPSLHASGTRYQWIDPTTPLATAPPALLDLLTQQKAPKFTSPAPRSSAPREGAWTCSHDR